MVRIEMKEIAPGQIVLSMEGKGVTEEDVFLCAMRGLVGVARKLLGETSTDPEFAKECGAALESMLKEKGCFRIAAETRGKEAAFMAALYGMNPGEKD